MFVRGPVPLRCLNRSFQGPLCEVAKDRSVSRSIAWSNDMISKFGREGRILDARKVFEEMPQRDVLTWTAMISGQLKCGFLSEARELFERVDSLKNVYTWTAMVRGYLKANQISEAERLFNLMPEKNVVSWNTMIDGYARNGEIGKALMLFDRMPMRNVVSWNTVLTALAHCGRISEARRLFDQMPERDVISWTAIVTGLSNNGRIDEARVLFDQMPDRNSVSWNAMVTGYAQNLRLNEAFDLFSKMPERDTASWNSMITGFIQNKDVNRAKNLFDEMPNRNVISWTAMITGYVQDGQNEEAIKFFREMQTVNSIKPNQGTFVSILAACSNIAGICEGRQIHQLISKTCYQHSTVVVSALINMYSKCGELKAALKLFHDFPDSHKDLVSWNGIISAYAHHGHGTEAIGLFGEMKKVGLKPDDVTYVELVDDNSIQLREDHLACLVDLCGRAGRLNEAYNFIHRLEGKPIACALGSLLAGCNYHGNPGMAKMAAKKLLEVEPDNAGTYMLLHNIYASSGKWKEAAKVRLRMKDSGLKKQPGCSWIEVGNRSYVFVSGDKSHHQSKLIDGVLWDLHLIMKKVDDNYQYLHEYELKVSV
ncbi:hypothetical protein V2J09_008203 [Rumex salicifolius]